MTLANLRNLISTSFNKGELRTLCFDLGVNYENLPGETLEDKARELVDFCQRRGVLKDLIEKCNALRPNTGWPKLTDIEFKESIFSNSSPSSEEAKRPLIHLDRKQFLLITVILIIVGLYIVKPFVSEGRLKYGNPVELEVNKYQVKLAGNETVELFDGELEVYFNERPPGTIVFARGSLVPDIGRLDIRFQGFPRQTFGLGLGEQASYETDDTFTILVTDIYFPDSDWGHNAYVELVITKE